MTDWPATLTVVNPTVEKYGSDDAVNLAPRLSSLSGKTIGLIWNAKPNGDVALRAVSEKIGEAIGDVEFRFYSGSEPCPPDLLRTAIQECDAFIACTAD